MRRSFFASLVPVLACMALAAPTAAQTVGGWTAYWENDSFVLAGGGSDRNYTNGLRFAWSGKDAPLETLRGDFEDWWQNKALLRGSVFKFTTSQWIVGQNFFTPAVISDYEVDPADRPYAGLAYFGLRVEASDNVVDDDTREIRRPSGFSVSLQHSLELDAGILGPAAGADQFQSFAHVLRESRMPKGWRFQLPHEPFLAANSMWRARMGTSFLDVTPHLGAMVGTVQGYGYAGATVRLGINMSDFPGLLIRPSAVPEARKPGFELALVSGVEGRAMTHNAFVQGGLRSDSDGIEAEHFVGDWSWGFSVRVTEWRVSWVQVRRSPEVAGDGPVAGRYHDYGSLSLTFEPGTTTPEDRVGTLVGKIVDGVLRPVFRGFMLEAGTGPSEAPPGVEALGSRLSVSKRFQGDHWAVGGEVVGIGRELGPAATPGGEHEDHFLVNKLITVRVIPFDSLGPGRLHLRAGAGGALFRSQITPGEPGQRPDACPAGYDLDPDNLRYCNRDETGFGAMLGAGYWFLLPGDKASLGVDYSWNHLGTDDGLQFGTVTFGFQWHP